MFAMDRQWWQTHGDEVIASFGGARYSINNMAAKYNVVKLPPAFKHYGNSGAACIAMAAQGGASRIVLLGFDCQHTGGKAHWHGNHPKGLGNAGGVDKWQEKFAELARDIAGIDVINATKETALNCWPRKSLKDLL